MLYDPTLVFSRLKDISAKSRRWHLMDEQEGKLLEFQHVSHTNLTLAFELHSNALWVVEAIDLKAMKIRLSKLFRLGEEKSLMLLANSLFTQYRFIQDCFCDPGLSTRF